jgi:hypothetical protein
MDDRAIQTVARSVALEVVESTIASVLGTSLKGEEVEEREPNNASIPCISTTTTVDFAEDCDDDDCFHFWLTAPDFLRELVAEFPSGRDVIGGLAQTSHQMQAFCNTDLLWRSLVQRDYADLVPDQATVDNIRRLGALPVSLLGKLDSTTAMHYLGDGVYGKFRRVYDYRRSYNLAFETPVSRFRQLSDWNDVYAYMSCVIARYLFLIPWDNNDQTALNELSQHQDWHEVQDVSIGLLRALHCALADPDAVPAVSTLTEALLSGGRASAHVFRTVSADNSLR